MPGKSLLRYSRTKIRLSRLQKQEVQKLKKMEFSKGINPWFWTENGHFSNFYFLRNTGQQNVFYDILERKSAFLG